VATSEKGPESVIASGSFCCHESTVRHLNFTVKRKKRTPVTRVELFILSIGDKWLCVVVKYFADDAFVITAYLTDKLKAGERIWPTK
jgi:hypothetical protein